MRSRSGWSLQRTVTVVTAEHFWLTLNLAPGLLRHATDLHADPVEHMQGKLSDFDVVPQCVLSYTVCTCTSVNSFRGTLTA